MDLHDYKMELSKRFGDSQQKYIYFILAANGSAIAFTIQLIISKNITLHLLILFLAILTWGISFFLGCKHLLGSLSMLRMSLTSASIKNPTIKQGLEDKYAEVNTKAIKYFDWMFRLLMLGMVIFISWFVISQYHNLKW
ncbi:MAG TPA: hypothetical protein VK588_01750 [Chitinophagaceae bacterium]|nr:hypothetical protein [Chitinophagaceae bacterium]